MRTEDTEKQKKVVHSIKCIKMPVHKIPKVDYKILINGQSI
jgi:hypothetical protein